MESSKEIKRLDTRSIESLYEKLSNETTQLLGVSQKRKQITDFDYEIYYLRVEAWAVIKRP